MGLLFEINSGKYVSLASRVVVGRLSSAALCIRHPEVSGEHASLYFTEAGWKLRDLGSRNGTWIDGALASGLVTLKQGNTLVFGSARAGTWVVRDARPPGPSARLPDGSRFYGNAVSLALPHPDHAEAHLSWDTDGWTLQTPQHTLEAADGMGISLPSGNYVLELPNQPLSRRGLAPPQLHTKYSPRPPNRILE